MIEKEGEVEVEIEIRKEIEKEDGKGKIIEEERIEIDKKEGKYYNVYGPLIENENKWQEQNCIYKLEYNRVNNENMNFEYDFYYHHILQGSLFQNNFCNLR
jgi:hypothetical protein